MVTLIRLLKVGEGFSHETVKNEVLREQLSQDILTGSLFTQEAPRPLPTTVIFSNCWFSLGIFFLREIGGGWILFFAGFCMKMAGRGNFPTH